MGYQFTLFVQADTVDEVIETLSIYEIYNIFYDQPIETITNENGYSYIENDEGTIPLHIIEEDEHLLSERLQQISEALQITKDKIDVKAIDLTYEEKFQLEDIFFPNGWKLYYQKESSNEEKVMILDPQGAFGTGLHETTKDCLRFIFNRDFTGQHVLDIGTGSGVLSIAAALKGAKSVSAIDIEPVEREVLYQAELNQLSNINVYQQNLSIDSLENKEKHQSVFINIGADETIEIITKQRLHETASFFLVSGVVEWSEERILRFFTENHFTLTDRTQTNEWVTLLLSRKKVVV